MAPILRIENISKAYRLGVISRQMLWQDWIRRRRGEHPGEADDPTVFWALRDVSFEVKPGEVVGLLGRNGAGKSTLLKILSEITTPTSGRVVLHGRVASLLEVGTGFHPELTGRDNIFLNGTILGMTKRDVAKRFDEIVAFSGIEDFISTPVKRYSVGMRVRLAFAIAAHLEPDILVIDEVLAVGDAAFQHKCLGKMDEVAHSGRTVLFVSHDAAAVESLCTRGIVLRGGRVVFDGSQTDAIDFHAAALVASGTDLDSRADRHGTGAIRVTSMELRNQRGDILPVARSGQDVEVALRYRNCSGQNYPGLNVQITVATHLGAPVFSQSNALAGTAFGDLPENGVFVCRIPKLPLPVGHFHIGFRIFSDPRGRDTLDAIENALDLHVEAGAFFPSGKLPAVQSGVCLVQGEWRLDCSANANRNTEGAGSERHE